MFNCNLKNTYNSNDFILSTDLISADELVDIVYDVVNYESLVLKVEENGNVLLIIEIFHIMVDEFVSGILFSPFFENNGELVPSNLNDIISIYFNSELEQVKNWIYSHIRFTVGVYYKYNKKQYNEEDIMLYLYGISKEEK